jgi:hypothetical protein
MTSDSTTSVKFSDEVPTNNEEEDLKIEQQTVIDNMPRKRPKTDADDNDNEKYRRKRRRMTRTKAKVDSQVKGSRRERRRRSISSSPKGLLSPTNTMNTRSTRRTGPSMLWELDDTSQPREIR